VTSSENTLAATLARIARSGQRLERTPPERTDAGAAAGDRTANLRRAFGRLESARLTGPRGRVEAVVGITVEAKGLDVTIGEICRVQIDAGTRVQAEVIGFRGGRTVLMPLGDSQGIGPGQIVETTGRRLVAPVGHSLLGRVLDGIGRPMDGRPLPEDVTWTEVRGESPNPLQRPPITEPFASGIAALDGLASLGRGQRLGIFSGSGVGKSTLLGMVSRRAEADVNVIALIGERGREVREFIEDNLGPEGLARSVVVVATSDRPPLERYKGAFLATTLAEQFRDSGKQVLFVMDSVTRFAAASREIGLALGEPPTRMGYPPSFFSTMPRLVERLGRTETGSITGLYTVLVEADDLNEPVTDTMRGLLDGHIILSRELAHHHHYPPIDILGSLSRLMIKVVPPEHARVAAAFRELYAVYRDAEDLIHIGAYRKGTSEKIDRAIDKIDAMNAFLRQGVDEVRPFSEVLPTLIRVMEAS
jgi:flagellum-specific ATP synthase